MDEGKLDICLLCKGEGIRVELHEVCIFAKHKAHGVGPAARKLGVFEGLEEFIEL